MNTRRHAAPWLLTSALLTCALGVTRPAYAQVATVGAGIQSYTLADPTAAGLEGVSLTSIPWRAETRLTPWAGLSIAGAYARATATSASGEDLTVSGLADTRVTLSGSWRGFGIATTAFLPSGEVTRSREGAALVGLLASDLLPFEVDRWGAGLGLGADVGYAYRVSRMVWTLSGGYSTVGEFTFADDVPTAYTAGESTRVRLGVDVELGAISVLSLLGGFQTLGVDALDGRELFAPGDRIDVAMSYSFAFGARESALAYVGFYQRGDGAPGTDPGGEVTPIEVMLGGARVPLARHLVVAGTEVRVSRAGVDFVPRGEVRALRSTSGVGQGWLASIETRAEYRLVGGRVGRRVVVEPRVGLRLGEIVPDAQSRSSVLGWEAGLGVRVDLAN